SREVRDGVPAFAGEPVDPVVLDLALRVQSELALDSDLDPKPLAVVAVLVALVEAANRLVALKDVLEGAAPGRVDTELLVRSHRPVDEAESGATPVSLAEPLEDPLLLPPGEDLLLEGGMIWILGQRPEHRLRF